MLNVFCVFMSHKKKFVFCSNVFPNIEMKQTTLTLIIKNINKIYFKKYMLSFSFHSFQSFLSLFLFFMNLKNDSWWLGYIVSTVSSLKKYSLLFQELYCYYFTLFRFIFFSHLAFKENRLIWLFFCWKWTGLG